MISGRRSGSPRCPAAPARPLSVRHAWLLHVSLSYEERITRSAAAFIASTENRLMGTRQARWGCVNMIMFTHPRPPQIMKLGSRDRTRTFTGWQRSVGRASHWPPYLSSARLTCVKGLLRTCTATLAATPGPTEQRHDDRRCSVTRVRPKLSAHRGMPVDAVEGIGKVVG